MPVTGVQEHLPVTTETGMLARPHRQRMIGQLIGKLRRAVESPTSSSGALRNSCIGLAVCASAPRETASSTGDLLRSRRSRLTRQHHGMLRSPRRPVTASAAAS